MKALQSVLMLFLVISAANAASDQKLEGFCSGTLEDGSHLEFTYYSDYDGCEGSIAGVIKFSEESGLGSHKGKRAFENNQDIYTFEVEQTHSRVQVYHLTFADSTGNISGDFGYLDSKGLRQSVTLQCEVRDYEYEHCSEDSLWIVGESTQTLHTTKLLL